MRSWKKGPREDPMREEILEMGKKAREAGHQMAKANSSVKREALERMAEMIERERQAIGEANAKDIAAAEGKGMAKAKVDRLRLSDKVLGEMVGGLREVALLPDPI